MQRSLDQPQSIIVVGEDEVLLIWMGGAHMQHAPQQCVKFSWPGSHQLHLLPTLTRQWTDLDAQQWKGLSFLKVSTGQADLHAQQWEGLNLPELCIGQADSNAQQLDASAC